MIMRGRVEPDLTNGKPGWVLLHELCEAQRGPPEAVVINTAPTGTRRAGDDLGWRTKPCEF